MLGFGIFRRLKDKHGELLVEFDADEVYVRLLERIHSNLPPLPAKRRLHATPRGWTKAELSIAFQKAWADEVRHLKSETIRIS